MFFAFQNYPEHHYKRKVFFSNFTSLYHSVLQSLLRNWELGYKLGNYVANYTITLQTPKHDLELQRKRSS